MDIANLSDVDLVQFYEGNGLFAKIIDTPAEEALKYGFLLANIKSKTLTNYYQEVLEDLNWEETAINAIRWARLFGGSIAVMLINDGRGIDEPLDWKNIQSIDDIRVYDRSVIQPDYTTMFTYSPEDPFRIRGSRLGMSEYYHINSKYGAFTVHESRCLLFRNGVLPENCSNSNYELWGMPEFYKLQKALSETELSHGYAIRLLEQAHQTVHKVNHLSEAVATDEGADIIRRRLEVISLTRSILNSTAIDKNDDYVLHNTEFTGVKDVVKSAYNHLSAVSSIPQKLLFGEVQEEEQFWRGYESTEKMWQDYIESIQARMLYNNLHYLLAVIFQAGANLRKIDAVPKIKIHFKSMRNLSELEEAQADNLNATAQLRKAQAAQSHIDIGSLSPYEVRKGLASIDKFDIATLIDKKHEKENAK